LLFLPLSGRYRPTQRKQHAQQAHAGCGNGLFSDLDSVQLVLVGGQSFAIQSRDAARVNRKTSRLGRTFLRRRAYALSASVDQRGSRRWTAWIRRHSTSVAFWAPRMQCKSAIFRAGTGTSAPFNHLRPRAEPLFGGHDLIDSLVVDGESASGIPVFGINRDSEHVPEESPGSGCCSRTIPRQ